MVEEVYAELSILSAIIGVVAASIFVLVVQRRRDLRLWLPAYISVSIGLILSAINSVLNPGGQDLVSNIFFAIAVIIIFIAIFNEYYNTFVKKESNRLLKTSMIGAAITVNPIILGLEIFIIIFCGIGAVLLFRIYWHKRTSTHAFLSLSLTSAILTLIMTVIRTYGVEGTRLYGNGITFFFATMLMVTAIVAFLDDKILRTTNDLKNVI
ncbi:MAG: hypothetical protein EU542_09200, partial [Promethearchaeota archaeon]